MVAHWFASREFALILPGTYYLSHKEKNADKVFICTFNHSILSETGKITHWFFYKSIFSEDGLKCYPKSLNSDFKKTWICWKKKKLFCQFKFVYFLETTMNEWLIFWINMMVSISLVVNSVLLTEVMPRRLR